jgi:hypothetical protein
MLPVEDDPFNFARYADPYPNYRRVRETTPVYWSQLLGGWVLTRHADVKAALVDKRLSAARTRDAQAAQLSEDLRRQLAPVDELLGRWALFQDNPNHRRIRQALTGAFTSSLLEQMRQRVRSGSTSGAIPTPTSALATAHTSASARRWPGWRARSPSAHFCAVSAISVWRARRPSGGQLLVCALWRRCR